MALPRLYLISDAERVGEQRFLEALAAAVSGGLGWVQLREPAWSAERIRALALRVLETAPSVMVTIGCRPGTLSRRRRIAGELGLSGLHLGGASPDRIASIASTRHGSAPTLLAGYSAHAPREVGEAFRAGADYVSFSPVFPPLSKGESSTPRGTGDLERACDATGGPVFALGGITSERVPSVLAAGAHGVAVIGSIIDRAEPALAARALLDALSRGRR